MRAEFSRFAAEYPRLPLWRDSGFAKSKVAALVVYELGDSIKRLCPRLKGGTP
jgi:hypothetical protein